MNPTDRIFVPLATPDLAGGRAMMAAAAKAARETAAALGAPRPLVPGIRPTWAAARRVADELAQPPAHVH